MCCMRLSCWRSQESTQGKWTIEIRAETNSVAQVEKWRIALLSSHDASNENLISRDLVQNVLKIPICYEDDPTDSRRRKRHSKKWHTSGYVDIYWRFQGVPDNLQGPTRFFISPENDTRYDALLGKKDSRKHGIRGGSYFKTHPFATERLDANIDVVRPLDNYSHTVLSQRTPHP